jgi:predicted acyl esterase
MRYLSLLLLFLLCTCGPAQITAQSSPEYLELAQIAHVEQKHMAPMRDGIRLATDIYRPKIDEKVPVILSRTPYQMNGWVDGKERTRTYQRALDWVKAGYAYVVQNERGRYYSEGEWDILGTPTTDGYDAFTWLAERDWSNGNIGLLGCSSTAEWQMAVASLGHPALKAIVPQGYGAGVGKIGKFQDTGRFIAHPALSRYGPGIPARSLGGRAENASRTGHHHGAKRTERHLRRNGHAHAQ